MILFIALTLIQTLIILWFLLKPKPSDTQATILLTRVYERDSLVPALPEELREEIQHHLGRKNK